ncbi:2'-5' RNA ligase family protein [Gracilimonas mengyeensis]|uniref:2'-5' RNA ligase n=1 Tax=Gracilimonas mengyeensis TaxID=1302730 RepID=A0A521C6S9_9BACT|nr:2'-5' RNA ligase family protein [Gracilimonas mengyeensis]SMO55093.1 2'-5' RNA ligase [Gracilimonas mengyeensis]
MDLETQYQRLWDDSIPQIQTGNIKTDPYIDATDDTRFGITLLARPSREVANKIQEFQTELRKHAPHQYYYPASDLHLTILSLVSCQPGFKLNGNEATAYINLVHEVLRQTPPFEIKFEGITASPAAVMICGYPEKEALNTLRDHLRGAFKQSPVYQTIDKRYKLKTAHSTIFRFRKPLTDPDSFVGVMESWKDHSFGSFVIDQAELVYNDWYQRKEKVRNLKTFDLKK